MKFRDVFAIALHNLWNNKSRTVLTVIIVTVVSTLIMALCLLGIAFTQNQIDVNTLIFNQQGTDYRAYGRYNESGGTYASVPYTAEEYRHVRETTLEYETIVDSFAVKVTTSLRSGNTDTYYSYSWAIDGNDSLYVDIYNTRFACLELYNLKGEGLVREGRIWSPSDSNTANVWFGSDYVRTLAAQGTDLRVGDKIRLQAVRQNDGFGTGSAKEVEYTVRGIFDSSALKTNEWSNAPQCVLDADYFLGQFEGMYSIDEFEMHYAPPETDYDYNAVYQAMKDYTKAVNAGVQPRIDRDGDATEVFSCSYVDDMRITMLMSTIIMALVIILAVIILLLSVGSVANTIIISVDKNRKFIGLMKAMGLNQKGVKRIVTCESLVQILLGVALGIVALFLLRPLVLSMMSSMFASMFAFFEVEYTVKVSIPLYLPILTALMFFLFASLFSRGSLGKIAKQDVISTISEVA